MGGLSKHRMANEISVRTPRWGSFKVRAGGSGMVYTMTPPHEVLVMEVSEAPPPKQYKLLSFFLVAQYY